MIATAAAAQNNAQEPALQRQRVAIIGAGAGGLVVLRECQREGHEAVCFEQGEDVGGIWRYSNATDTDPLSLDPQRAVVHTSMYQHLRTNLPRQIMGYSDFPMDSEGRAMQLAARFPGAGAARPSSEKGGEAAPRSTTAAAAAASEGVQNGGASHKVEEVASQDGRIYPRHDEVQRYLRAFAAWHGLTRAVRYNSRVVRAMPVRGSEEQREGVDNQTAAASHTSAHQEASKSSSSSGNGSSAQGNGHVQAHQGSLNGGAGRSRRRSATRGIRWLLDVEPSTAHAHAAAAAHSTAQQQQQQQHALERHEFDAVVVCNGHYTEPNLPAVPGMTTCRAFQMHSHNYRTPEPFRGQVVLVVGASNSGEDISREVAAVAQRVHVSARDHPALDPTPPCGPFMNMYRRPMVSALTEDGRTQFPGGYEERVDAVIYCTGYRYAFPFLPGTTRNLGLDPAEPSTNSSSQQGNEHSMHGSAHDGLDLSGAVVSKGHYVEPLYKHLFPPSLAPSLSFVGLPWKVVPFPQMELQAKLIARVLSGQAQLPSQEEMEQETRQHQESLQKAGVPLRYAHMQNMAQFDYNDELAEMAGVSKQPSWRRAMYAAAGMNKRGNPENYRDTWPEPALLKEADQDFQRQLAAMEEAVTVCAQ